MKNKTKLLKREDGVIHHLGLIIFALVIVGVVGFALHQIQNQDPNYGYNDGISAEDEDQTQTDLEDASDQADARSDEADEDLSQVTTLTEENDEN